SMKAAEEAARTEVPAGRLGRPEELAAFAAFLCSERASFVTGTHLAFDGGRLRSV
ncbi:MAG: 3-oxoacyl-[acyl-carrier protein] reductase, partial [Verrucomicrobiota bacterium]